MTSAADRPMDDLEGIDLLGKASAFSAQPITSVVGRLASTERLTRTPCKTRAPLAPSTQSRNPSEALRASLMASTTAVSDREFASTPQVKG